MKGINATADEKKLRQSQTEQYKRADWAYVIKCTANGGGAGRMVKRGN
jgi:hypothetical protein